MSEEKQPAQQFTLKNDRYRKLRGGVAKFLDIFCAKCNTWVLLYQKDGIGRVLRFYLNRIFAPPSLAALQHRADITEPKDMSNLVCPSCGALLGTPFQYNDGRLAYRLPKGSIAKKNSDGTYPPPPGTTEKKE
ncbi:MAG: hypothetical protein G01um101438_955 [Parcubacteria group bacterium Gr01-1014_38]|nr:MAG: hypothetical protein G01um101438_955 [Parcubacteria group bacterium Gr01-1014_38]